jgi:hypothetical protein
MRVLSSPLEHNGQAVMTLAQVDEAHERPKGTAGRNFRQHRDRLMAGLHFFEVSPGAAPTDEIRRLAPAQGGGKPIVLLTRRGYLMLAKALTDPLAWEVQDRLVESYFRMKTGSADGDLEARVRQLEVNTFVYNQIKRLDDGQAELLRQLEAQAKEFRRKIHDGARASMFPRRKRKKGGPSGAPALAVVPEQASLPLSPESGGAA